MSHYDWIIDGLAALGFLSLLALGGFFFIMARQALEDRLDTRKARHTKAKTFEMDLETLKAKWQGVAIEQH